jgi:succinyl-CoA synthetase beta subunit
MDLLEYEAKRLFGRHGIVVPRGGLWPDPPAGLGPCVVKAQVRAGGRGKQGGIRFASSLSEARAAAQGLLGSAIGDAAVERVYIEERLDIARELYLAVTIDRDARCHTLLASSEGGVEVEAVAAGRILRVPIDPVMGLRPFAVRRVVRFLGPPDEAAEPLGATVQALYDLAMQEEATLAEINPLALTADGRVVAADAKVSLDDRAAYRHPDWSEFERAELGTLAERAVLRAGGVAAEVDPEGDVVGVISGAGLMMATLDMMVAHGIRVRCVIDMGGTPLGGSAGLIPIFEAVAAMRPKMTFINAYFHTALADSFARGVLDAAETAPLSGKLILRLVGRRAEEGRRLLAPLGFETHEGLVEAIAAVAAAAQEPR